MKITLNSIFLIFKTELNILDLQDGNNNNIATEEIKKWGSGCGVYLNKNNNKLYLFADELTPLNLSFSEHREKENDNLNYVYLGIAVDNEQQ